MHAGGRRVRRVRREEKENFDNWIRRTKGKPYFYSMEINEITSIIIEECIYIHRELGPGLLESVYEEVLYYRLKKRRLNVTGQQAIPVNFEEVKMEIGFRADLIVENLVIVGLKSLDILPPVHFKHCVTYLNLAKLKVALMNNFNEVLLKNGIQRIVNNY